MRAKRISEKKGIK